MSVMFFEESAFRILVQERLLPHILSQKRESLRIWSIGCQAGDEALLLLLRMVSGLPENSSNIDIKIFATDPDINAITRSRRLASSNEFHVLPSFSSYRHLLEARGDGLSCPGVLREPLIFAHHDLVSHMPFPRLDLIVCHFPLSSFDTEQQAEILHRLGYALVPQGLLLLLDSAEQVSPDPELFSRLEDSPVPLFKRTFAPVERASLGLSNSSRSFSHVSSQSGARSDEGTETLIEELQTALEEQSALRQELEEQMHARKRTEEALLHLAAIISCSDDAILSKDLDGTITSWNAGAERLYGYSAQEMVGQSVTRLLPSDRQDEFTRIMERILRGERVDPYETNRLSKDGNILTVSITVSPIKASNGVVIGASAIARDIRERKALEQQREAFVGLVTHELKTPLTALQGNVQLAHRRLTRLRSQTGPFAEEQQRALEEVLIILDRSQRHLRVQQRLINDLLDLSRIQEGKVTLRLASCNLVSLVSEAIQDHRAAHPTRLITLDEPGQDEILVYVDRDRIQQVLGNYLANALKFASANLPVRVGIVQEGTTARVWVQDEGPGLSREQQASIWKRFYQVTQTPVQSGWKVGLGLGLYICQQLIRRHQGQVGVESIPGQGATFWFSLPLHVPLDAS
jgi:two-component system sensor histidine kinase VicK